MSRTSKALRRLSVPVLVGSVIMSGTSLIGFAGVANAASGVPNGTLTLSFDNPNNSDGSAPAAGLDSYAVTDTAAAGTADTIDVTVEYDQGTDGQSTAAAGNVKTVTLTASGSGYWTTGPGAGTSTTTCDIPAGDNQTCTATLSDPVSEAVTVTASAPKTVLTPLNDPTVPATQGTAHFAGLFFSTCQQRGTNLASAAAVAPDNHCSVQLQSGVEQTQTLTYRQDGVAKSGVTVAIAITTGNAQFTNNQEANITPLVTTALCTTNAQGQCTVRFVDNTNENDNFLTASTSNDGPYPTAVAQADIDFVPSATPGRIVDTNNDVILAPPTANTNPARPGYAIEKEFQLLSTCTTVAPARTCTGTPLVNRTVSLTVDHGFFTPNCSASGLGNDSPSYGQCKFSPTPVAGDEVGNLQSLGTTINVTTGANGIFYATVGIKRDAGFDDDGNVDIKITGTSTGGAGTLTANNAGDGDTSDTCANDSSDTEYGGCATFTEWSTDSRPLNVGSIGFVGVRVSDADGGDDTTLPDGDDVSKNPNNVPSSPSAPVIEYVVHLTDQFGNLTSGSAAFDDVDIDVDATDNAGCNDEDGSSVNGSFLDKDTWDTISSWACGDLGLQTVVASYPDQHTIFNTYTPATNNTPAVATFSESNEPVTATVKFNFYDQLAQPVITFSTTPSNTVTKGTAVTVSATVKDQFGNPIPGQRVTFLVTGPNQSSCNPTNNTTIAPGFTATGNDGRAGFVFSCNSAGQATVSIVVTDPSNNELARGVQNVTFTEGAPPSNTDGPAFTINTGTIKIGQCATLRITAGGPADVLVKGQGAKSFTKLKTLPQGGAMAICPSTNSLYQVSNAEKLAPQQLLLVKAIQTLVVKRVGQSANFSGHVIPGVVGRRIDVFYYTIGEHVQYGGLGKVEPGGNFSFTGAVNRPGKVVYFFARTYKDDFNTSGQSPLVKVQF